MCLNFSIQRENVNQQMLRKFVGPADEFNFSGDYRTFHESQCLFHVVVILVLDAVKAGFQNSCEDPCYFSGDEKKLFCAPEAISRRDKNR